MLVKTTEYPLADFYVNGNVLTTTKEIFDAYEDAELFSSLEERIICYLLSQADVSGRVPGRSSQIIDNLLYMEYADADDMGKELLEKEVKGILHSLYKRQFIARRKNQEVFICSNVALYRHYGFCDGIIHITITSVYDDGDYYCSYYNVLGESDSTMINDTTTVREFVNIVKLGRISQIIVKLSSFTSLYSNLLKANQIDLLTLKKAGWIEQNGISTRNKGKCCLARNKVDNVTRLIYDTN
jgi:hypothetical protein